MWRKVPHNATGMRHRPACSAAGLMHLSERLRAKRASDSLETIQVCGKKQLPFGTTAQPSEAQIIITRQFYLLLAQLLEELAAGRGLAEHGVRELDGRALLLVAAQHATPQGHTLQRLNNKLHGMTKT